VTKVSVVGTTSWGTTLAVIMARRGLDVYLWARTPHEAAELTDAGQNARFVSGVNFPPGMQVTASSREAFRDADVVIIAVPAQSFRDNIRTVSNDLKETAVVVSATKGLELESGKRMSQVLSEELPQSSRICALSGPNLAGEIVRQKPSSTVVASSNLDAARLAQGHINTPLLRVYTSEDIVGVELGGALKNIIALGAGICDRLGYGDNAKASFMTRGLAEISRLGVAAGANPMTFAGLAGIGDMVATCSSRLSRNHGVGERLADGESLKEIQVSMDNVAEGVDTTAATVSLAKSFDVEMPITEAIYDVLFNGVPLRKAISQLLIRTPHSE